MEKITDVQNVKKIITEFKTSTAFRTNIVAARLNGESETVVFKYNDAIAFIIQEKNRDNLYFASANDDDLTSLLKNYPHSAFCDIFYRTEEPIWEIIMSSAGWKRYARYYRTTVVYGENPNSFPIQGRRAILQQLYDPTFGEVAKTEDIPVLMGLFDKHFDARLDDYYDEEQWKEIIARRECLVHKEEGEIVTVFVYRIEKNKLYNSMILNLGPANWSYNLERRVLDEAWERGIRTQYWSTREENTKAVVRQGTIDGPAIKSKSLLYNDIYTNAKIEKV